MNYYINIETYLDLGGTYKYDSYNKANEAFKKLKELLNCPDDLNNSFFTLELDKNVIITVKPSDIRAVCFMEEETYKLKFKEDCDEKERKEKRSDDYNDDD